MKFLKKYWKLIIAILVSICVIGGGFVGNYFYNFALNPQIDKSGVTSQDDDGVKDERKAGNIEWFNNNKQEVTSKSVTGDNLVGYKFLNDKSNKWVIVVHGFTSEAKESANYIKGFYDRGYNIFAPDLIAHGKSEGKAYSMGGYDAEDLVAWINKLSSEYKSPDMILFGTSMGATTVMNSLGKNLPENVKGFIEDSGYVDLNGQFVYQLDKLFGLPSFPVIPLSNTVTKIRAGYSFSDVNVSQALKDNKLPALVLHGEKDGFVPLHNAYDVFNTLKSDKVIVTFPDSKHCKAEKNHTKRYWQAVDNFLVRIHFSNNAENMDLEYCNVPAGE